MKGINKMPSIVKKTDGRTSETKRKKRKMDMFSSEHIKKYIITKEVYLSWFYQATEEV